MSKSEFVHLNRLNRRMIGTFSTLCAINVLIEQLSNATDQPTLNKLAEALHAFEMASEHLKGAVTSFVKEAAGLDDEELEVEETEQGYKL